MGSAGSTAGCSGVLPDDPIGWCGTHGCYVDHCPETPPKNNIDLVLKLVELFSRATLNNKGLGDRYCIEAIHTLVAPLVSDPIGLDEIALVK